MVGVRAGEPVWPDCRLSHRDGGTETGTDKTVRMTIECDNQ